MRKVMTSLMALLLVLSLSVTAFAAESSVTFEGKTGKFSFEPGSSYTDTDLFDNFKGVMPGDTVTETITVTNKAKDCDYVKIYMRAVAHDESGNPLSEGVAASGETVATMQDFLSQLSMKVYNGKKLIYEASPDELDGLSQNVLLGTLRKNKSVTLTVELEVPIELGNEYANRVGEVDWIFTVEAYDDPPAASPITGDQMRLGLVIGVMCISAVAIVVLVIASKKKKNK